MRWLWENSRKHSYKMSGAVYQPTTVTYESNGPADRWQDRPISYLGSISQSGRRPCGLSCLPSRNVLPLVLITSCIACFALGLAMLINGALGYSETSENKEDVYLIVTIFGALFFALSILLFLFFMRITRRMCWRNAKDHLGTSGGQNLTVNPSTDLLVTAQYAPVSEVVYEGTKSDDTEQSKLMSHETKEISNEDADRMVENDPRIVLRPLNSVVNEET
ncbi:uncharacterized protein LOC115874397 isoform X2 [Sitophilus oryzae]|uniref:Uncharacterized protein LOC115874397 isoform X2 n=1 Tax=Sitophilus oryzae TaxID=7048 RepID=A0A6J2X3A0_SITOR|nr:uncharacterized protein LOC115874397 isoform X2 [Sitophilus oryzae]